MRDPSRIPTHHGVFHFRERQCVCVWCVRARASTLALNRHIRERGRAPARVHLSTFVSIACEKRRGEKRPLYNVSCKSSQIVVAVSVERRFRSRARAKRFISRLGHTAETTRSPTCARPLRFNKIAFQTRNGAA